ncbi:MAG: glycosyltransferase, partial [Myxococcales bacterium]|nr:glycosyltransferase [Myxococcales bacterium]
MPRARIALVVTRSDAVGGSQIHVRDLALALRADGFAVRILVGGRGPYVPMLQALGLDVVPLRHLVGPVEPAADLRAVLELRRALRAFGPDLVALHTAKAGLLGRLAARGLGVPVVLTPHGWAFVDGVPRGRAAVFRALERLAAPLTHRIITVSEFSRTLARRAGVGTVERVRATGRRASEPGAAIRRSSCRSVGEHVRGPRGHGHLRGIGYAREDA